LKIGALAVLAITCPNTSPNYYTFSQNIEYHQAAFQYTLIDMSCNICNVNFIAVLTADTRWLAKVVLRGG